MLERHRQPLDDEADDNIGSSTGSESSEAEYFSPSEGEGNLTPPRCAWPHRTTTIFLHPNAAPARLSSATVSQNVRDAWRAGRRVPGALHPVKVVEIELERGWNGEISDGAMEALTALLYAEGKTWWQEGRARVGGYGDVA